MTVFILVQNTESGDAVGGQKGPSDPLMSCVIPRKSNWTAPLSLPIVALLLLLPGHAAWSGKPDSRVREEWAAGSFSQALTLNPVGVRCSRF